MTRVCEDDVDVEHRIYDHGSSRDRARLEAAQTTPARATSAAQSFACANMAGALAAAHCVASVTKQHVDLELENVGDTADHEADHRVPTCASLLTGRALAKTRPMLCVRVDARFRSFPTGVASRQWAHTTSPFFRISFLLLHLICGTDRPPVDLIA